MNKIIDVVIPAFNEEKSIGLVIQDIPHHLVRDIVVINNNSTDKTGEVAKSNGATVLLEERPGYGSACLKGLDYLSKREVKPDIVVFLDADYSDHPNELEQVVFPILEGDMKMVIGVRHKSKREKGSMTPQQVFGNWLATSMMQMMYGIKYNDLGPFSRLLLCRTPITIFISPSRIGKTTCSNSFGWSE